MKIDAINFGAFTEPLQSKRVTAEETGTTPLPDDYDDTRLAEKNFSEQRVSAPIERTTGTVEDLIQAQSSTEQMARSYGFANVAEAQSAISAPVTGGSSVSAEA